MNKRLLKIKSQLIKDKLDGVLVSSYSNLIYLTDYSGFTPLEREAFLLISKNKQYLITDPRSSKEIKKQVKDFQIIEITSSLPFKGVLEDFAKKSKTKLLGIEEKNISVSEFKLIKKYFKTKDFNINKLREVKDSGEILKIKKACVLTDITFDFILKHIKLGVTEKELMSKIELFIKKNLADISFPPIVAFGKNSSVPHHIPNNKKLINNQIILLDFGIKLDNYCSDMTRTVFFGRPTDELKKIYETVFRAQQKAINQLKNKQNINTFKIDKTARDYILSKGYPSIPHSVGHGIGIEVHELPHISPNSKEILKDGMVFSIEPGIYLPNIGGVRIEDLVVFNKRSLLVLTRSPKNLIEI